MDDKLRVLMAKPKILMFGRHFRPSVTAGGAARSMTNLIENLGHEFDFWVVCRDRDLGSNVPFDFPRDNWLHQEDCHIYYCRPRRTYLRLFSKMLRSQQWDMIYVNSYVSPIFSVVVRLLRRFGCAAKVPMIIAPRGEFAHSALKLSALKKKMVLTFGRHFGFHHNIIWQASCKHEHDDIVRVINPPLNRIVTAPDLSPLDILHTPEDDQINKNQGELTLALVARIAPIKNILFGIEALRTCKNQINYEIYGPIEDEDYWAECQATIAKLPPNVIVNYHGSIDREEVPKVLARAHAFFMPTLGENFGHSILEALAASLPVIISDQTPWRDLEIRKAGFDLPLGDRDQFTVAIDRLAEMNGKEFETWRISARSEAQNWLQDSDVVEANRQLFHAALGLAPRSA